MSSRSDGFFPQAETMTQYEKGYQKGRSDVIKELDKVSLILTDDNKYYYAVPLQTKYEIEEKIKGAEE